MWGRVVLPTILIAGSSTLQSGRAALRHVTSHIFYSPSYLRSMVMPLYLYQGAYTAESLAAQIKEPKDRIEVVTK
jgi:hypothetical protein